MTTRRLGGLGVAVVAAVFASALALTPLITPGRWALRPIAAVAITAVVLLAVRPLAPRPWIAPAAGLVTALVAVTALLLPETGIARLIPTTRTLTAAQAQIDGAIGVIERGVPPIAAPPGLVLLVAVGLVLVLVTAEHVAVGLRLPASSGLPLLALWVPAIALQAAVPGVVQAAAGAGFLAVLLVGRPVRRSIAAPLRNVTAGQGRGSGRGSATAAEGPSPGRGDRRRRRLVAAVITGGFTAAALVAPMALGPLIGRLPPIAQLGPVGSGGAGTATRLDLALDLRADLTDTSDVTLVSYTASRPTSVGPLRAYTVVDFDGRAWQRDRESGSGPGVVPVDPDDVLWPQAPRPEDLGSAHEVRIRIAGLAQDRLLVPTMPRAVAIDGDWYYDPETDEILTPAPPRGAVNYTVFYRTRALSDEDLKAQDPSTARLPDGFLSMPQTSRTGQVAALAAEVAVGAETAYDRAFALQNYLRDTGRFTYSTDVQSAQSDDAVWDFLQDQRGYCVQFATAMVVMARSLGIPARLAIGYLPGELTSTSTIRITPRQAHAWPELYFPESGWVRFEPTPAVQSGPPPIWANPVQLAGPPVFDDVPDGVSAGALDEPEPVAGQTPAGESSPEAPRDAWATAGIIVAALLGLGLGLVLAVRIRRARLAARRSVPVSADEVWQDLRRRLAGYGVTWADSATLRQVPALVGEQFDASGRAALTRLAAAVERERYAPPDQSTGAPDSAAWTAAAARVIAGLRDAEGSLIGLQSPDSRVKVRP